MKTSVWSSFMRKTLPESQNRHFYIPKEYESRKKLPETMIISPYTFPSIDPINNGPINCPPTPHLHPPRARLRTWNVINLTTKHNVLCLWDGYRRGKARIRPPSLFKNLIFVAFVARNTNVHFPTSRQTFFFCCSLLFFLIFACSFVCVCVCVRVRHLCSFLWVLMVTSSGIGGQGTGLREKRLGVL